MISYARFSRKAPMPRIGSKSSGRIPHERVTYDGEEFDSLAEKDRYIQLKLMQKAGQISELKCHPRFEIIPKQETPEGEMNFKSAHYTADFQYVKNGETIVEDVKSKRTREEKDYILRRKLMWYMNHIYVHEVVR